MYVVIYWKKKALENNPNAQFEPIEETHSIHTVEHCMQSKEMKITSVPSLGVH